VNAMASGGMVETRSGARLGLSRVLAFYLLGGPATGALIGFLLPRMRTTQGAIAIGLIVAVPIGVVTALLLAGPQWSDRHTFVSVIITLLAGPLGGLLVRHVAFD
jgi:hypothetical protein